MSPEDVKPEWVEKAARALAENEAPTVPWDDWARVSKKRWRSLARAALAAVLPEAMSEGWAKGYAASDYEAYHLGTHGRTDDPYREGAKGDDEG